MILHRAVPARFPSVAFGRYERDGMSRGEGERYADAASEAPAARPARDRPLRVLSIAHTAVRRDLGRLRYYPLAARRDLEMHLLAPERWVEFGRTMSADPPDDPGLSVHLQPVYFPSAGPMHWYLHVYPRLGRLIRLVRPEVIHLWEEPWSAVAFQACALKGDAALVLEVDQNICKRLPPPFEAMRRHVLARTAHILSRSPDATAVVREKGYTGPVTAIGYGVDTEVFRPAGPRVGGRDDPSLRIGYVGRVVEEKGLDDVLDALVRVRAPVSLAIMGEGDHEDPLRRRVAELGLGARVTFRGWADLGAVSDFLRGLDALILPARTTRSWREQFGRVIIEAQSCGIPVIGSNSGAIPSVVGSGGWIVPERDPEALARAIDALHASPADRRERGEAAIANVAERFTYEAVAESLARSWNAAAGRDQGIGAA